MNSLRKWGDIFNPIYFFFRSASAAYPIVQDVVVRDESYRSYVYI